MPLRFSLLLVAPSLFLIAGAASTAGADMTAYRCDAPDSGPIEAIVKENACVGYRLKGKDAARRVDFNFTGSGKLIASADGRTVVMLQSYLYGRVDGAGDIVGFDGSAEHKNPIAVHVYRDGKEVATHRIHDLLDRKRLVTRSTSHVRWVRTAPAAIPGRTFTITTSSFREITFDSRTGKIIKENDTPEWSRCDLIISGTLDLRRSRIENPFLWKSWRRGAAPIRFVAAGGLDLTDRAHATACFERRGTELALTGLL